MPQLVDASILLRRWTSRIFAFLLFDSKVKKNLACSRTGLPSQDPAGKRNNRLRPTCEMAPPQCLLFYRREWGSHDLRSNLLSSYVVFQLSCFLWPSREHEEKDREMANQFITNYDVEKNVNWENVKKCDPYSNHMLIRAQLNNWILGIIFLLHCTLIYICTTLKNICSFSRVS